MSEKRLTIKSGNSVLAAYIVAPLAGMAVLWVCIASYDIWRSGSSAITRDFRVAPLLFIFGTLVCGIAELLFVAPLLFLFRRYRWRWLNGWTAGCIGFLTGYIFMPLLEHASPGAMGVEADAFLCGLVGLTIAMVFRLVAITTQEEAG